MRNFFSVFFIWMGCFYICSVSAQLLLFRRAHGRQGWRIMDKWRWWGGQPLWHPQLWLLPLLDLQWQGDRLKVQGSEVVLEINTLSQGSLEIAWCFHYSCFFLTVVKIMFWQAVKKWGLEGWLVVKIVHCSYGGLSLVLSIHMLIITCNYSQGIWCFLFLLWATTFMCIYTIYIYI